MVAKTGGVNKGIDWDTEAPKAAALIDEGMSVNAAAETFGVGRKTLRECLRIRGLWNDDWSSRTRHITTNKPSLIEKGGDEIIFPDYPWPRESNWREYFSTWDSLLEFYKKADPFVEHFTIDLSHIDKPVAIASASDLHLGGGFTNHKMLAGFFEYVLETDGLYVGLTGDTIEGFIPGVKPSETIEQQISPVKAQLWALESLVDELVDANKLLWMTWGDHDAKWFEQTIGINIVKKMVQSKVPYFMGRGLIKLNVDNEEYFILANHIGKGRSRWSNTHGGRIEYESEFPADVVITGHTHKPEFRMFWHYERLREMGLNIGGKSWLVQNGTFKTGPDPYTIRTWSKGIIGVPTIVFDPETHDCDVFESPAKAMRYVS